MSRLFANNRATTLSGSITDSQTNIPITNGNAFPEITGTDNFYVTLDDGAGVYEILLVTAHSAGGTTLTATRGQDGTAAAAWPSGTLIEMRVVAQEYNEFVSETDADVNLQGNLTVAGDVTFTGTLGVPSGGTGNANFPVGSLVVGAGTADMTYLEPGGDGTPVHLVATVDGVNWTSESTDTLITKAVIDTALASPNMLEVPEGGTGRSSLTAGAILVGNGTGPIQTITTGNIASLATTLFFRKRHEFTAAGTYYFTPADGAYLRITAKGAGGGGGREFNFNTGPGYGGAGGAGGVASGWFTPLANGTELTVVVPAGGAGATGGAPGGDPPLGSAGVAGAAATVDGTGLSFSVPGGAAGGDGGYRSNGGNGADGNGTDASVPPAQGEVVPPIITETNGGSLAWGHPATGGGGAGGAGGIPNQDAGGHVYATSGTVGYILIDEYY